MFRIRTLTDATAPANQKLLSEIKSAIRAQFPQMPERDIAKLPEQIDDPFQHQFLTRVLVAEGANGKMLGFSIIMFDPRLQFAFLELISTAKGKSNGGVGQALYAQTRERAREQGARGLFFECLPDEAHLSPDPVTRRQNRARLRFYERFGAYPIEGTLYDEPVEPGATDSPFLVFDGLDAHALPDARRLRRIVRAILERKYAHLCPPAYVAKVLRSIRQDRYKLRAPRYLSGPCAPAIPESALFPLIVNEGHDIHHVRERGYVEAPARVGAILRELSKSNLFERRPAKSWPLRHINATHAPELVAFLERACAEAPEGKSIYPYVFPIRNAQRMPKERSVLSGYWCIDTFTPINRNAYPAARGAVDCALTAAECVLNGARAAYALVRPPGHHAERRAFGGFCYFNNAAVAAHYLSQYGRVAVLDVDYHHGNGTQDIFYERADVLTVSIHGDPSFAYPYFTGFSDEAGRKHGAGFNLNLPLEEDADPDAHRKALRTALARIERHRPAYLVVALGLDTAKGDPTGTWSYAGEDFTAMGEMIAALGTPTMFVQEGGYSVRDLGVNARRFFEGVALGLGRLKSGKPSPRRQSAKRELRWREAVQEGDAERIEALAAASDSFSAEEIAIAKSLAEERIAKGRRSGYRFILAERGEALAGYACFGRTPGTAASYDLYWIVTSEDEAAGLGSSLLERVESAIRRDGGRHLAVETSMAPVYARARSFYESQGFAELVVVKDFYRPGEAKVMYRKDLGDAGQG